MNQYMPYENLFHCHYFKYQDSIASKEVITCTDCPKRILVDSQSPYLFVQTAFHSLFRGRISRSTLLLIIVDFNIQMILISVWMGT